MFIPPAKAADKIIRNRTIKKTSFFRGKEYKAMIVIKLAKPNFAPGAIKGIGIKPSMMYKTNDCATNIPSKIMRKVLFIDNHL
ncbi:hypothetical protein HMPREF3182_00159 [Megasphaera hutchinsoni]|uniref:Uncharacterized protein n=1 Tax=Megasphaera hutchinsoni TaxID=1588748 RepID=A0A134CLC4_9FIRM|nr:hypothetical protein HMPREF3182_00159 [Megasphaera hutchinsoni]